MQNKKNGKVIFCKHHATNFEYFFIGRFIQENKSTKNFLTKTIYNYIHVINKKNKNRYTRFLAEY